MRDAGGKLSFDPSSFQLMEEMGVDAFLDVTTDLGIDILLPNKEEGAMLSGETEPLAIAGRLAELYKGAQIILKLDAEGALLYLDGESHHIPPATNNLVDATGAGDSFAGAYLARTLRGVSEVDAAQFACQVAAWVIERLGARPSADPALDQLLR